MTLTAKPNSFTAIDSLIQSDTEEGVPVIETIEKMKKLRPEWMRHWRWTRSLADFGDTVFKAVPLAEKSIEVLDHVKGQVASKYVLTRHTAGSSTTYTLNSFDSTGARTTPQTGGGGVGSAYSNYYSSSSVHQPRAHFMAALNREFNNYRRKKIEQLRKSLTESDLKNWQNTKEAQRTNAIVAMATEASKLISELEAYRRNIMEVETLSSAEKLLSRIEESWRNFQRQSWTSGKIMKAAFKVPASKTVAKILEAANGSKPKRGRKKKVSSSTASI